VVPQRDMNNTVGIFVITTYSFLETERVALWQFANVRETKLLQLKEEPK
jgi:predicted neuraminidase